MCLFFPADDVHTTCIDRRPAAMDPHTISCPPGYFITVLQSQIAYIRTICRQAAQGWFSGGAPRCKYNSDTAFER